MLRRLVKRLIARQTAPAPPSRAQDVPAWEAPHEARASTDDIFYCFRLLLDRSPNMEEWAGHSSRAGEPLGDVVQTYVNSAEFNARRLLEAKMPEGVVCRHNGKFQVFADSNDPLIGVAALNGAYEPPVANVIETLLKPGITSSMSGPISAISVCWPRALSGRKAMFIRWSPTTST